jgi:hypothetical protein
LRFSQLRLDPRSCYQIEHSDNLINHPTARSRSLATESQGQLLLRGRDELSRAQSLQNKIYAELVELRFIGKEFGEAK